MGLETEVAVLASEIASFKETVVEKIDELKDEVKNGHERIHQIEVTQATLQERVSHMRLFLLCVNAVSSAIAGLVGWFRS